MIIYSILEQAMFTYNYINLSVYIILAYWYFTQWTNAKKLNIALNMANSGKVTFWKYFIKMGSRQLPIQNTIQYLVELAECQLKCLYHLKD